MADPREILRSHGLTPKKSFGQCFLVDPNIVRKIANACVPDEEIGRAVFMVQLEVCERLLAAPGSKAYGALTVFVRAALDVERVMTVGRGAFHPQPDVTSAVVRFVPRPERIPETSTFRALVKG